MNTDDGNHDQQALDEEQEPRALKSVVAEAVHGREPVLHDFEEVLVGTLLPKAFKQVVRKTCKIPPVRLSDRDLDAMIWYLTDDQSGSLKAADIFNFVHDGVSPFDCNAHGEDEDNVDDPTNAEDKDVANDDDPAQQVNYEDEVDEEDYANQTDAEKYLDEHIRPLRRRSTATFMYSCNGLVDQIEAAFAAADMDGNGEISRSEALTIGISDAAFTAMDTNQDGAVDYAEFTRFVMDTGYLPGNKPDPNADARRRRLSVLGSQIRRASTASKPMPHYATARRDSLPWPATSLSPTARRGSSSSLSPPISPSPSSPSSPPRSLSPLASPTPADGKSRRRMSSGTLGHVERSEPLIKRFKALLLKKQGSFACAWRRLIDTKWQMRITQRAFYEACRANNVVGYGDNLKEFYLCLDADRSGSITLHNLDSETTRSLSAFIDQLVQKYGSMQSAREAFGFDRGNSYTRTEFMGRFKAERLSSPAKAEELFKMLCNGSDVAVPAVTPREFLWLECLVPHLDATPTKRLLPGADSGDEDAWGLDSPASPEFQADNWENVHIDLEESQRKTNTCIRHRLYEEAKKSQEEHTRKIQEAEDKDKDARSKLPAEHVEQLCVRLHEESAQLAERRSKLEAEIYSQLDNGRTATPGRKLKQAEHKELVERLAQPRERKGPPPEDEEELPPRLVAPFSELLQVGQRLHGDHEVRMQRQAERQVAAQDALTKQARETDERVKAELALRQQNPHNGVQHNVFDRHYFEFMDKFHAGQAKAQKEKEMAAQEEEAAAYKKAAKRRQSVMTDVKSMAAVHHRLHYDGHAKEERLQTRKSLLEAEEQARIAGAIVQRRCSQFVGSRRSSSTPALQGTPANASGPDIKASKKPVAKAKPTAGTRPRSNSTGSLTSPGSPSSSPSQAAQRKGHKEGTKFNFSAATRGSRSASETKGAKVVVPKTGKAAGKAATPGHTSQKDASVKVVVPKTGKAAGKAATPGHTSQKDASANVEGKTSSEATFAETDVLPPS